MESLASSNGAIKNAYSAGKSRVNRAMPALRNRPEADIVRKVGMSAEINVIATSSIQEGLDFACSLLSNAIAAAGQSDPERAVPLLNELTNYIQFRYVGEEGLALESLSWLGRMCDARRFQSNQFWSQMKWLASACGFEGDGLARLELPE